jgi:predicted  nucleic acid-binding Zn-ribbon protein
VRVDAREKAKVLQEERIRCKALEDELTQTVESHVAATRHLEELSREKSRLEDLQDVAQTKIGNLETSCLELDQRLREADKNVDSLKSGMFTFS